MAAFEQNGISIELPKWTLAIASKMDEIEQAKSMSRVRAIKAEYPFVVDVLGREAAKELLGGDNIDSIDVGELDIVFCEIVRAYNAKSDEYNRRQQQRLVDTPAVEAIGKLSEQVKTITSVTK